MIAEKQAEIPSPEEWPRAVTIGAWAVMEKIANKAEPCPTTGCWIWTGNISMNGYGTIVLLGAMRYIHRIVYEVSRGHIPRGMVIDHVCRLRCCVNPLHMEICTIGENTLRGMSPSAVNKRMVRCKRGHDLIGGNVRWDANGKRLCVTCARVRAKAYRDRD